MLSVELTEMNSLKIYEWYLAKWYKKEHETSQTEMQLLTVYIDSVVFHATNILDYLNRAL